MYAWQRQLKDELTSRPIHHFVSVVQDTGRFYFTVWFAVPVAVLLASRKDTDSVVACALLACAVVFSSLYPFFFPHYFAAYTCIVVFVIARGLMKVGTWTVRSRNIGYAVVTFLVVGGLLKGSRSIPFTHSWSGEPSATQPSPRQQVVTQLERRGGQHDPLRALDDARGAVTLNSAADRFLREHAVRHDRNARSCCYSQRRCGTRQSAIRDGQ